MTFVFCFSSILKFYRKWYQSAPLSWKFSFKTFLECILKMHSRLWRFFAFFCRFKNKSEERCLLCLFLWICISSGRCTCETWWTSLLWYFHVIIFTRYYFRQSFWLYDVLASFDVIPTRSFLETFGTFSFIYLYLFISLFFCILPKEFARKDGKYISYTIIVIKYGYISNLNRSMAHLSFIGVMNFHFQ